MVLTAQANSGYDTVGNDGNYNDTGEAPPLTLDVGLGPLHITARNARLLIDGGLTLDLKDGGNGDGRLTLSEISGGVSSGSFSNIAAGTFNGLLQAVLPVRVGGDTSPITPPNPPTAMADNEAWVSVLGKLTNLGSFDFQSDPNTVAHNTGPASQPGGGVDDPIPANSPLVDSTKIKVCAYNVQHLLDNLTQLNLANLITGLGSLLDVLSSALEGRVFGQELPLIGDALKDNVAAKLLRDIKDNLIPRLQQLSDAGQLIEDNVKQAIFDKLGPSGLNILGDHDGDQTITANDVSLVSDSQHIQFNIHLLGQRVYSHSLAGDFGFPYLGLTVDSSTFQVTVGLDMQFGFGVSKNEGFYFDTSSTQELALTTSVAVPGLSATGYLGFLNASLADNPASPTAITAAFGVDVKDMLGGNNRLTFTDLTNGDVDLVPFASVYGAAPGTPVNINLLMGLDMGSADFPRLKTNFMFQWGRSGATPG